MGSRKLMILVVVATLLVVGVLTGAAPARANSNTIWYEGQITDGPWSGEPRRMAVNGVTFSLMPDAPVYRRTTNFSGITQQGAISFRDLRKGQQVMIRIQGHRIYQVIVLK